MTVLQAASLVIVVMVGTAVVLIREPLRQALVLSVYGLALTLLFFIFQAPDVALSALVVSAVGMPVIILAALRKLAQQTTRRERNEEPGQ